MKEPKQKSNKQISTPPLSLENGIADELIWIFLIVLSVVVFMSQLTTDMGFIGDVFRQVLQGLFGFGGLLFPLLMIAYSIWMLLPKQKNWVFVRIMGGLLFLICISATAHLFQPPEVAETATFLQTCTTLYTNASLLNGGVLGGWFGGGMVQLLGVLGTCIVLVSLFVVSLLMMLGCSILTIARYYAEHITQKKQLRNERIKYQAAQIQKKEQKKQQKTTKKQTVPKQNQIQEPKTYNFELNEQQHKQKRPRVQITMFPKNKILVSEKKRKPIYDFVKESKTELQKIQNRIKEEPRFYETPIEQKQLVTELTTQALQQAQQKMVQSESTVPTVSVSQELPPLSLLTAPDATTHTDNKAIMIASAKQLESTLKSFGVDAKVLQINKGPTVTRYEVSPSQGVKVSKIVNLSDDIALNLAASGIRMEAPIPGKSAVGIEVPNTHPETVHLRTILESEAFQKHHSKIAFALGMDIAGSPVVADIATMPHLLIAGATGSGKSVCINALILSILYKATPKEVKLILIDPKMVELGGYKGIPHLMMDVVTQPERATDALQWAVQEMTQRYNKFANCGVRDLKGYNRYIQQHKPEESPLPQIVIIIDELSDLMMTSSSKVEDAICRLAQMARAAGMHLVIATQRPSVDVLTGVIKANIPSRLAFAVSSGIDSRTILDMIGAEKLLGKGDMLFYPSGYPKPARMQCAFVTDEEVEAVVNHWRKQKKTTKS